MVGLPAGVQNTAGTTVPLTLSGTFHLPFLIPSPIPRPSHGGPTSTLWAPQERNGFLQQRGAQPGKPGTFPH